MDLVFYWQAFKHWWWVLLLTIAATIPGILYFENQRGKLWQAEAEINVMGPFSLSTDSYSSGVAPSGGITSQFDFTHIANSAAVAVKTIHQLNLPQDNPTDLFTPPINHPTWPSVQVINGDPMGDAASQGLLTQLLGGSTSSQSAPKTHLAVVRSTTYGNNGGEQLATDLATTYAKFSMDEWNNTQVAAGQAAFRQLQAHVDRARADYVAAQAAFGKFLVDHNMSPQGTDMASVQQSLDALQQQRAALVAAASSQQDFRAQKAALDQQIAEQQAKVEQEAALLGAKQAEVMAQRTQLQSELDTAKNDYQQAFANQEAARQEIAKIAAQGYPSERPSKTIQHNPGQTSDSSTSSNTAPSAVTSNSSGSVNNPTETTTSNGSSHSSRHSSSSSSGSTPNGSTSRDSTGDSTGDTTSTSTTVRQGSTTTSSSSTTTNDPGKTTTTATHSGSNASTQVTVNDNPVAGITSPEQASYYLGTLQFATQANQGSLTRAQANLSAFEQTDPTPAMSSQLENDRATLATMRQTSSALTLASGDTAAGLGSLDQAIQDKRDRLAQLTALQPQYSMLQNDIQTAQTRLAGINSTAYRFDQLQRDAVDNAGTQVFDARTFRGQSKTMIELIFGFLIAFLVGASVVITLEYIRYSQAVMRMRNGGTGLVALGAGQAYATALPPAGQSDWQLAGVGSRLVLPEVQSSPATAHSDLQVAPRDEEPRSGRES